MNDTTWFWKIVDARGLADVSSDEFVALNELVDRAERCKAAERKLPEAIEALSECEEYFDNRADADCDQDGFIPNKEMRLLSVVRTALRALENGPAGLADATPNPPLSDLSSLRKGAEVMRAAIKSVTDATGAYLPPDGISKDELISRVLAATDNPEINAVMLGGRNGAP